MYQLYLKRVSYTFCVGIRIFLYSLLIVVFQMSVLGLLKIHKSYQGYMKISNKALIESRSVRDEGLSAIGDNQRQLRILNKVKKFFFVVWKNNYSLTLEEVAEYYEVSKDAVSKNYQRHGDEFLADGARTVEGQELQELKDIMSLRPKTKSVVVFNVRSALRMGFILEKSDVAVAVRTAALNIIEGIGRYISSITVLEDLIEGNPKFDVFVDNSRLKISSPLADHYDQIKTKLKDCYPTGGISGLSARDIRDRIAALSTRIDIDSWRFRTQKEIQFEVANNNRRYKYPDFSIELPVKVDGEIKNAYFMFLFDDLLTDYEKVESCAGRNYISRVKENPKIDYAFLFFISPFGVSPDAEFYINNEWFPEEERGYIGALTVKELSYLLIEQAKKTKSNNLAKGQIKRDFKELFDYQYPLPILVLLGTPFFSSPIN